MKRREFLKGLTALPLAGCLSSSSSSAEGEQEGEEALEPIKKRRIPGTQEDIPILGLGTYQAFSRLGDSSEQKKLIRVLERFVELGGRVVDTSPMYSSAETVLGELIPRVDSSPEDGWFMATKVWTDGRDSGVAQMAESAEKTGFSVLDLMQIHNLRDWRSHLSTLKQMKAEKKIRYIGATTWGGLRHDELEVVMRTGNLDFIQVTYNVVKRDVEERVLPLAQDLGLAVIVNRPFAQGALFGKVKDRSIPDWVRTEADCKSWAQVFLKFVLADPRVTVAIPATSKPKHLTDNMGAGRGRLPGSEVRERMAALFEEA